MSELHLRRWSELTDKAKPLRDSIVQQWIRLLETATKEEELHKFLAANAGLFFLDSNRRFICLSKVRLGANHVIDFAVATEGYSRGLSWNLIEIELARTAPYNKDGTPSARLTRAVQQTQDWRRWIQNNRREVSKLFPTIGLRTNQDPNITFTVFIGTRENSRRHLDKRNSYADAVGVEVRSFEYLTSMLTERWFGNHAFMGSHEENGLDPKVINELANPFASAIPDAKWRQLVDEVGNDTHFCSQFAEHIVKYRPINLSSLARFAEFIATQPLVQPNPRRLSP
jgi:Domain of unknown function (DUF4263)